MNLYLETNLARHRHGRFFATQLHAQPADDLPSSGLVLMHGKTFQSLDASSQHTWWAWSGRPGCALVLIAPFNTGGIYAKTDWNIALVEDIASSDDGVLPACVAGEVIHRIQGNDGEFDRGRGHQWRDYSINTRYYKQHSGSGIFAATCLPLWSISLLDHAEETIAWLENLMDLAGQPDDGGNTRGSEADIELEPTDYTLMVCLQAWGLESLDELKSALATLAVGTFNFSEQDLVDGFRRLSASGFLDEQGLSAAGITTLAQSSYWAYAIRLKEESQ